MYEMGKLLDDYILPKGGPAKQILLFNFHPGALDYDPDTI